MKFLFVLSFGLAMSVIFLPSYTLSASTTSIGITQSAVEQLDAGAAGAGYDHTPTDPRIITTRVIEVFLGLIGSMAIFLFVYAGYLFITSHGDTAKLSKASKIMTGAVIGMLLILMSFSIANFVGKKLQQSINQGSDSGG
ncbi:MAG: hypothetical protein COU28_03575 [Candidatus Magasanikbacteria bacterium CG10_big_fil_rev_8_21_14_0_10_36_16]|uniref:Uncharacterized protein n=1 Tax=Candidatus Magasanikbacteria bacterium CG10_big_fil_rev_8_21_14_0_10_36_16 TaxID=1974645 RepID=A0A2H0TXX8_9BACT|nr:MAG: hypothetical protein COU28_03575 [Candidatus Magasanikbacteria bacterium CG10_big_fil_rev_8_21_14_0_10_36_16]